MFEAARPKGESAEFCEHERGIHKGTHPLCQLSLSYFLFWKKKVGKRGFCVKKKARIKFASLSFLKLYFAS